MSDENLVHPNFSTLQPEEKAEVIRLLQKRRDAVIALKKCEKTLRALNDPLNRLLHPRGMCIAHLQNIIAPRNSEDFS